MQKSQSQGVMNEAVKGPRIDKTMAANSSSVAHVEENEEQDAAREAAEAALRHHGELIALAASRTEAAAIRMVLSRRGQQRARLQPLVLPIGQQCRVSFLYAATVRMQLKVALITQYLPTYTTEVYIVTARHLAPGSRRIVLYDLECADTSIQEGEQVPTRINQWLVRLPLRIRNCDRRWLQVVPSDGTTPTLARRFPGATYAFNVAPHGPADEPKR